MDAQQTDELPRFDDRIIKLLFANAFVEIPLENRNLCQEKWIYQPEQCQYLF